MLVGTLLDLVLLDIILATYYVQRKHQVALETNIQTNIRNESTK